MVNGVSKGVSQTFGSVSGADATVHTFTVNDINVLGDVVIEIRHITGGTSNRQLVLDNISWTGFTAEQNLEPEISNVVQAPTNFIQPTTSVSVAANVTDQDGSVELVQLRWGQLPDLLTNTIPMVLQGGSTYVTQQNIPAMPSGTTVYYQVYAEDNEQASSLSSIRNYSVDPTYFSLETFEAGLGNLLVRNVQGNNILWTHDQQTKAAQMNGGDSEDIEEDWLIVPSINMRTNKLLLDFDTWRRDGGDDYENYFKVYYSTSYPGTGDPNLYTWVEINCTLPEIDNVWTNSGLIDLSAINLANVHIGFKYYYTPGNFTHWRVDNIRFRRKTYSVTFNVTNNTLPVADALVEFNSRQQRTNASGQTIFTQVETVSGMPFTVSKDGFHPVQGTQTVTTVNATRNVSILNDKVAINVEAQPSVFEAAITWTGSGADQYGIYYYETATQIQNYITVPAGPTSIVVAPQTNYGVRVRSLVNGVWTAYSPTVFFTTGQGTPIIAREVSVNNISSTSAIISWVGEGATQYGLNYFNLNNPSESYYQNVATSPQTISVLPERTYVVRVRTLVDGNWTNYSPSVQFSTPSGQQIVASDVFISNINSSSATVNWQGEGAERYAIYYQNSIVPTEYYYLLATSSPTTISVLPNRTYKIRVRTWINGAWSSYTPIVTFSTPGAKDNEVFDLESAETISLYPNPASSYVVLNIELAKVSDVSYTIYDIKGSVVKVQKHSSMFGIFEERIELEGLSKGVYFIKVNTPRITETLRLIVQ